jgi:hypothetical protein
MSKCVVCEQKCKPAPTERGWMSLTTGKGIHYDCLEHIWTAYKCQPSPELVRQERDALSARVVELKKQLKEANDAMQEAVNNCEVCRDETDRSRKCARCQTFIARVEAEKDGANG